MNLLPEELRPDNVPKLNTSKLGIVSNFVPNGPNKLYCGGIPYSLTEDQVKELLSTYGQLRAFFLAKDQSTGLSKGYCFFQYEDASVTDSAIQGLNGIKIGDRQLAVRRHTPSQNPSVANTNNINGIDQSGVFNPLNAMISEGGLDSILPSGLQSGANKQQSSSNDNDKKDNDNNDNGNDISESNILVLLEMVTQNDLMDDDEYKEIVEDIRDECSKYGVVVSITIPRPNKEKPDEKVDGLGKVFVEFTANDQAIKARDALQGRTFENRIVIAQFYDPIKYSNKDFST